MIFFFSQSLKEIEGLSEAKIDQICEAAEKIMVSPLTKQYVKIVEECFQYTRETQTSTAEDHLHQVLDAYSHFMKRCFTVDEMAGYMLQTFNIPKKNVKKVVEDLVKGKVDQICFDSYTKDSEILSHFRNEKKSLFATQQDIMQKQIEGMDVKLDLLDGWMKRSVKVLTPAIAATVTKELLVSRKYLLDQIQRRGALLEKLNQASGNSENLIEETIKKRFKAVGSGITRTVTKEVENLLTTVFSGLTDKISSTITSELSGERITNDIKATLEPERRDLADHIDECIVRTMYYITSSFEESLKEA
ncbi:unnamed protein product [Microthlaspi erraticum]|uniref:Uncharacterized protein n=1 Tax=Microthlaspi erraticum TaxID=1685480 RepID=A0A6D2KUZ7_9BRAS|nr:unnamed protein product [Microthlaspi erraticum]